MLSSILIILARVCGITEALLLIYCVLTWFVPRTSRVMQVLSAVFDPMLMPIRSLMMCFTGMIGLDFSPMILILILQAAQSLLIRLAWML